jgi:glucose/arabinose dehydrogenase
MNRRIVLSALAVVSTVLAVFTAHADYHLERITGILNQPTYVTQAPGDPANILYYTTRISTTVSGFTTNFMGKVWRYDTTTRVATPVLDFSSRPMRDDEGLECIAFHPDFNTPLTTGHGKVYVSSAIRSTKAINFVEEFILLNADGTFKDTNQAFATSRVILRYTNSAQHNHTVGWLGFDPNATGAERQYLYISTGDGSFGNNYNSGSGTNGRPSENPSDVKGKILRVDISGPDFYPADSLKNFDVPPSNPLPAYNAAHPGAEFAGLGEVYATGLRNGYRMSFDRATSDIYWGDVGEDTYEEVNFLRSNSNPGGLPLDFGWPQFEGIHNSTVSGAPHSGVNPFTGVPCFLPVREHSHAIGDCAIGGYVYRGPIPELQGKYFYADFVAGRIWMLDFNRDTPPSTFNGSTGTITEMTGLWSTMIVDPLDPTYAGDTNINTQRGIDHVVSFGEDNAGNLYVVDFGFGAAFNGQYTANAGEIFKLVTGAAPPVLNVTTNGSGLQFSWTGTFHLQYQTNGPGLGLGTNWINYPGGGSNPVTVPFNLNLGSSFFRLVGP